MSELVSKRCAPCTAETPKLTPEELEKHLPKLPGWQLSSDRKSIERRFQFKNYYETMAFVNAVAWVAHREDHHPDLEVSYNRCSVRYNTHAVGGLSENDVICAAKVSALIE
jgi:4a-hydroxytetrahydrobiopterin dehydratase